METRNYQASDLEEVKAIANAAWQPIIQMGRKALGDNISKLRRPAGDAIAKGLEVEAQMASGHYQALVCVEQDHIVGFITFCIDGKFGEICNNAALPNSGLKGVGQCMYRAVLELMKQRGVKVVSVTTGLDEAHAPARRAYERAGFVKHLDSTTYFMEL